MGTARTWTIDPPLHAIWTLVHGAESGGGIAGGVIGLELSNIAFNNLGV